MAQGFIWLCFLDVLVGYPLLIGEDDGDFSLCLKARSLIKNTCGSKGYHHLPKDESLLLDVYQKNTLIERFVNFLESAPGRLNLVRKR